MNTRSKAISTKNSSAYALNSNDSTHQPEYTYPHSHSTFVGPTCDIQSRASAQHCEGLTLSRTVRSCTGSASYGFGGKVFLKLRELGTRLIAFFGPKKYGNKKHMDITLPTSRKQTNGTNEQLLSTFQSSTHLVLHKNRDARVSKAMNDLQEFGVGVIGEYTSLIKHNLNTAFERRKKDRRQRTLKIENDMRVSERRTREMHTA